jgi:hypothetical protein
MDRSKTLVLKDQDIVEINGKCQYPHCDKPATDIVEDRERQKVEFYCADHATDVVDHGRPEYNVSCPNCGCYFGVN